MRCLRLQPENRSTAARWRGAKRSLAIALAGLAFSGLVLSALAWTCPLSAQEGPKAPAPLLGPQTGYLLLRNGNLLRGDISQLGDRYIVALDARNEVRMPADQVELFSESLVQIYQHKRTQLPPGKVDARLDLAEWCLRQGLRKQAADETTIAMRLEPDHPRLPGLERRIQAPERPTAAPDKATSAATPATVEQLEQAARELPFGAVERFTSSIQPMLINRCGANSCHGAGGDSQYHLLRPPPGQSTARRFTLRNLYATLQSIDRESPDQSRLLAMARQPHGAVKAAPFGPNEQVQYELLAAWVRQIQPAKTTNPAVPASIVRPGEQLLQTTPLPKSGLAATAAATPTTPESQKTDAPAATSSSAATTGVGRDPFDPELFNRQFGSTPR